MITIPPHVTKSWLKKLSDDELWEVYEHFRSTDEYLSLGLADKVNVRLIKAREQMEKRGLL